MQNSIEDLETIRKLRVSIQEKMYNHHELSLGDLPCAVLEIILFYFSYERVAQLRRVNRRFNNTCKYLLNKGFRAAKRFHSNKLKDVKALLPRRESKRRNHELSRHYEILTALDTRISLLSHTFLKYVNLDLCCFIPGKVIDVIFSVLRTIRPDNNLPRSHKVLQELRDISTMAMEHFDEEIRPPLRTQLSISSYQKYGARPCTHTSGTSGDVSGETGSNNLNTTMNLPLYSMEAPMGKPLPTTPTSRGILNPMPQSEPSNSRSQSLLTMSSKKISRRTDRMVTELKKQKKQADNYKGSLESQNKKIVDLDKRINQQNKNIRQQNARLAEQEEKLTEMNRRLLESEQMMADFKPGISREQRDANGQGEAN